MLFAQQTFLIFWNPCLVNSKLTELFNLLVRSSYSLRHIFALYIKYRSLFVLIEFDISDRSTDKPVQLQ